jgi:site-specific recombinase XerD
VTIRSYYTQYKVFFNWLVEEGVLETSPMSRIRPPKASPDQIEPFSDEHLIKIERAAAGSDHPRRDLAIVHLLLDSGLRASELCSLRYGDLDLHGRRCTVLGKGNKKRTIYFGRITRKALFNYLKEQPRETYDPVFLADRGRNQQEALTRSGLRQLIKRLGDRAGLQAVRCSPHTFRHSFAIRFLRSGGNVFTLQQLMGHSSLQVTQRYCALAEGDLENQHRQFAPTDRLNRELR